MIETLKKFEKGAKAELKPKSVNQYKWFVREFLSWLDSEPKEVSEIEITVEEFLEQMAEERGWSDKSCKLALYSVSRLYNKTLKIDLDPSKVIIHAESTDHQPTILTREEVDTIFEKASVYLSEQEEAMLNVGWECALRAGELVRLKGENLLEDSRLECPVLKSRKGKERFKTITIPEDLHRELEDYYKDDHICLFHNPKYGKRYSGMTWSGVFSSFVEKLDLEETPRYHDFARHTRLTHLVEDTKSVFEVLQLSGHVSVDVCRKYFRRAEVSTEEFKNIS